MRGIDHRFGLVLLAGAFVASLVAACNGGTATPTQVHPSTAPSAPASPDASPSGPRVSFPIPTAAASRPQNSEGDFVATGSMTMGRSEHTATLLPDGRVLIVGGQPYKEARSAELYDPKTGTFAPTGSPISAHLYGTATPLLDGRVLLVGGWALRDGFDGQPYDLSDRFLSKSAELYDPKTGTFTQTGSLVQARLSHSATRLQDGRVLITGGVASLSTGEDPDSKATAKAEIYDPATGKFTATGSMTMPRWHHSATLLNDGRVLVAGSWADHSAELYDPVTGKFSRTGSMKNQGGNRLATLLRDGRVLMVGGGDFSQSFSPAEIYDPQTGKFSPTGSMVNFCNDWGTYGTAATAPVLRDGRVLVPDVHYLSFGSDIAGVELYDPVTGKFTQGPQLIRFRSYFTETLLADGRVLFAGNSRPNYPMDMGRPSDPVTLAGIEVDRATAEIFVP
jgi:hypothetical protein